MTLALAATAGADENEPPRVVDEWHEQLRQAVGSDLVEPAAEGWTLGLYPSAGLAVGPSNWIAYQFQGYVSFADEGRFSLFAGYGYERGPSSKSHMATVGWGGVRRLIAARPQRGFYGKFLRYRKLEHDDHGVHHGLSVGVEHGAGAFGLSVELGAARSTRGHWAVVAQVGVKLVLPVIIPWSRAPSPAPHT